IRNTLAKARPAAKFLDALAIAPNATPALMPDVSPLPDSDERPDSEPAIQAGQAERFAPPAPEPHAPDFVLTEPELLPQDVNLPFAAVAEAALDAGAMEAANGDGEAASSLNALASLKPLGQLRESFILAVNEEGLWIIDQHVAHERVLFEKILRERDVERVERQRLLMPLLVDLLPEQMVRFAEIAEELERNGFEVEPFGPHTIAVKAAPMGLEPARLERMLMEVLEQAGDPAQSENLEALRTRIAASLACHSAIKVNMPLDTRRMEWLLGELAKTEHPTNCPHGRPITLRYSWKDIQKAFSRI
ncbi:MAG: DNA mismatch repair endonuclease MutL, partial [Bryobacteraceae bacterium]